MFLSYLKLFIAATLAGILWGIQPLAAQSSPTAQIIFYQKGGFGGNAFDLRINGIPVAEPFRLRRKFEVRVPADTLLLETRNRRPGDQGQQFQLVAQPGRTYYIEGVLDYDFLVYRLYLLIRQPKRALSDLNRLKTDPDAHSQIEP